MTIGVTLGGRAASARCHDRGRLRSRILKYVGYEGTGERIRALVGGNLDMAIGDVSSAGQFVENGDLVFLATGAPERLAQAPDVPTFKELGADLELAVTRGIVMPKGSPEEARDTLEAALGELAQDEDFVEQVNNAGAEVASSAGRKNTQHILATCPKPSIVWQGSLRREQSRQ